MSEKPVRVQRKRTKGYRLPPNTVSVTRPGPFGNPFKVGGTKHVIPHGPFRHAGEVIGVHEEIIETEPLPAGVAVEAFGEWLAGCEAGKELADRVRRELRGKNLACYCPLDKPCHADVLLRIANEVDAPAPN